MKLFSKKLQSSINCYIFGRNIICDGQKDRPQRDSNRELTIRVMQDFFKKIASCLYGAAVKLRHLLFDINILRSEKFKIPIICVGNVTVGGTGKTPVVEMLVRHYSDRYNVAVLSRGFGRKTKGYRVVETTDVYTEVGDEPLQIKRKFPNVTVVVCEKRAYAIHRIQKEFPNVNMILMDDGFQHRYVDPLINIVVVDHNRPPYRDHLLPYGDLRDVKSSLYRAHYFIVTKCPAVMKPITMREYRQMAEKPAQGLFFASTHFEAPIPVFANVEGTVEPKAKVIAMSGIGNPKAFNEALKQRYKVVGTLDFSDHHIYHMSDLARMLEMVEKYPDAMIMTTEKDAVKLSNSAAIPENLRRKMFYEKISISLLPTPPAINNSSDTLFERIDKDIKNKDNGTFIRGL